MTEYTGWEEWETKFKPISNKFSQDSNQRAFQPHGNEEQYVRNCDPKFVWTHINRDSVDLVTAGCISSRDTFSYFITEIPWDSEEDHAIVALEVECDCSATDDHSDDGYSESGCDTCGGNGFFSKVLN